MLDVLSVHTGFCTKLCYAQAFCNSNYLNESERVCINLVRYFGTIPEVLSSHLRDKNTRMEFRTRVCPAW